jgi:hypothetical protein
MSRLDQLLTSSLCQCKAQRAEQQRHAPIAAPQPATLLLVKNRFALPFR